MDGKQSITEEENNRFKTCFWFLIFTALQHIRFHRGKAANPRQSRMYMFNQHFTNGNNYSDVQSFMNNVVYFDFINTSLLFSLQFAQLATCAGSVLWRGLSYLRLPPETLTCYVTGTGTPKAAATRFRYDVARIGGIHPNHGTKRFSESLIIVVPS